MATLVLSAVGAAAGSTIGGGALGLSSMVIGRAVGAVAGRMIDQRLLGGSADPVETGRVDRLRITGASEGAAMARIYGRMRVAGQVIWATNFMETSQTTRAGKGQPGTTAYSYTISLAIALCEGPINGIGRIWADGTEIAPSSMTLRLYHGDATQQPDPRISAVEGPDNAPAYRGTAYVLIEDLDLAPFGNRVPQFNFEVIRNDTTRDDSWAGVVQSVALIPGTGEYALATEPVALHYSYAHQETVNENSPSGKSDLMTSLDQMNTELPRVKSVSLVVSWFGDDLRAGHCTVQPKVEQTPFDAPTQPWRAGGITRAQAATVPRLNDAPVYGGTPGDTSVIQSIRAIRARGQEVMFYPFILMDQQADNTLPNPWTGTEGQPAMPWRGRITTALAPGLPNSPHGTAAADAQVAAFFGTAAPSDFRWDGTRLHYTGPAEWSLRRFILHYAHLCTAAGGVDSFCIGSEMVALTQIRGATGFPAVDALCQLATDVRAILGPDTKISYAADWSEYHGTQPAGTSDKYFHLDPLWAHEAIDFIGIDNYMPLSDWRDGTAHADAAAGAIYNLDYLRSNVAGGEMYDWFYASDESRDAQIRTPITDGYGQEWMWRMKDILGWWSNAHFNRVDGDVGAASPWQPRSKPIRFTEIGCAAIDKGTNQPNKFLDPKSSESALPYYSNGLRDDFIQLQYLRALTQHYADPANNPPSDLYDGPMIEMDYAHVWAWDARPFPWFPARQNLWSDGTNYDRGHWLNGRAGGRALQSLVGEICTGAQMGPVDTSALWGTVHGYALDQVTTGRAALQPLMLSHGFDAVSKDGTFTFQTRHGRPVLTVSPDELVQTDPDTAALILTRQPEAEMAGQVRVSFIAAEGDFATGAADAVLPDARADTVAQSELPLLMTRADAKAAAERWLAESRLARETATLALPPSRGWLQVGDVLRVADMDLRIDQMERGHHLAVTATRVSDTLYQRHDVLADIEQPAAYAPPMPVAATFLDLPSEDGVAAHIALTSATWPGEVVVQSAAAGATPATVARVGSPSVVGETLTPLPAARAGVLDRGPALRVKLISGDLGGASLAALLDGANLAALGDGESDVWEVFQFAGAELVGPQEYALTLRLRGQGGTDGIMPPVWPVGTRFILLDQHVASLPAPPRGVARDWLWGPAQRPTTDRTWRSATRAFAGIALRPYAPCHLRSTRSGGDVTLGWQRRTRSGGDSWDGLDVPLAEDAEAYRLRLLQGGSVLRDVVVGSPAFTYTAAMRTADAASGPITVEVAQLSQAYGAGPALVVDLAL
ncbi:hypothetical protein BVG79_00929 [Ketogulonicigenium robustum]|uniref:Host specificity protein n=1 Tax=Ketogulonicigenium robustum TaxID=92947 RepID=A0A1W6NYN1_9RHOB|nr:glycoside hydrolase TIM-barrel-like domain-containing protein [Ketogulonicigenium robustum]ARO14281.1 hypothetical protein BVG79_00929 [Ketogulonicigenium robustum]